MTFSSIVVLLFRMEVSLKLYTEVAAELDM